MDTTACQLDCVSILPRRLWSGTLGTLAVATGGETTCSESRAGAMAGGGRRQAGRRQSTARQPPGRTPNYVSSGFPRALQAGSPLREPPRRETGSPSPYLGAPSWPFRDHVTASFLDAGFHSISSRFHRYPSVFRQESWAHRSRWAWSATNPLDGGGLKTRTFHPAPTAAGASGGTWAAPLEVLWLERTGMSGLVPRKFITHQAPDPRRRGRTAFLSALRPGPGRA